MVIIIEIAQDVRVLRRCDARCYNAKGKNCKCICGAINHGKGIDFALQNAVYTLNQAQKNDPGALFFLSEDVFFISNAALFPEHNFRYV